MSNPDYTSGNVNDGVAYLKTLEAAANAALHGSAASNPNQPLIDRERFVRQQRSAQIQLTRVTGTIQTSGAGEALVDVAFPVMFAEKPAFSFGGEMGDNQVLVDASFPTVSAIVHSWVTEGDVALRYKGAKVAVVTTGPTDMQMSVLVHFEAKAFQNPVDATANIGMPAPTPPQAPPVENPPGEGC